MTGPPSNGFFEGRELSVEAILEIRVGLDTLI